MVRPPQPSIRYFAFCDNSGGRSDSFALAIAHYKQDGTIVLDFIAEWRPPQFTNPSVVVAEMGQICKSYRCQFVTGDAYAAEWAVERFREVGLNYRKTDLDTSQLYLAALPKFASGLVRLVDNSKVVQQFAALERRTMPGGKDKIQHPKNGHDDLSNACAGALVIAARGFASINSGFGITTYGTVIETDEDELDREPIAKEDLPKTADQVAAGFLEAWKAGGDRDKIIADLRQYRRESGETHTYNLCNAVIKEITSG